MKICMISYSFYESDTRIMQYANALAERGDTVDVIALGTEDSPETEVIRGVRVFRIQKRTINEKTRLSYLLRVLRFLLFAGYTMGKRQRTERYQVIHVHSVPDFLVFAAVIPKLFGARVILDIHDILPEFYASKFGLSSRSILFKLLVLTEKASISFADYVIIANDLWKEKLLARSVSSAKCAAFVNYPDPDLFVPQPKMPTKDRFVILYPGTLNRHQGLDVAIRAFALVTDKMPGAVFEIYGEGSEKNTLIELAQKLKLNDRIQFHNFIPTDQIATIMATADLAVVPKRASSPFGNEAASTKIMEFMAVGVPVIVSRTKIDSFYHTDATVKFFESENEEALAEAIYLMWRNSDLRDSFRHSANVYVAKNSWKTRKSDYLALIDRLAAPPVSRGKEARIAEAN